jgi:hypothetical protein
MGNLQFAGAVQSRPGYVAGSGHRVVAFDHARVTKELQGR